MTGRDETWFEDLFHTHHPRVLQYARRRVGAQDADDIVVEVFAVAWRERHSLPDSPDQQLPWLYRCAWHRVANARRSQERRDRLERRLALEPTIAGTPPELDWVHDVLDRLPETDAEILRLSAWEGLEPREIADVLGAAAPAVRLRLHRARTRAAKLADSVRGEQARRPATRQETRAARVATVTPLRRVAAAAPPTDTHDFALAQGEHR